MKRSKNRRPRLERFEARQLLAADLAAERSDYDAVFGDEFAQVGTQLFFAGNDERFGQELWVSDGEGRPARMVAEITPGPQGTDLGAFTAIGELLFFGAQTADGGQLWRSDGTSDGTFAVDAMSDITSGISALGNQAIFRQDGQLAINDGTIGGTSVFWNPNTFAEFPGINQDGSHGIVQAGVFHFLTHSKDYYTSDGTANGTTQIANLGPDAGTELEAVFASEFGMLLRVHGASSNLYLIGSGGNVHPLVDEAHQLVSTIDIVAIGDQLYFQVVDSQTGTSELWVTEGSPESTQPVHVPLDQTDWTNPRIGEMGRVGEQLVVQVSTDDGIQFAIYDPTGDTWRMSDIELALVASVNSLQIHVDRVVVSERLANGGSRVAVFNPETLVVEVADVQGAAREGSSVSIGDDLYFVKYESATRGFPTRDAVVYRQTSGGDVETIVRMQTGIDDIVELVVPDQTSNSDAAAASFVDMDLIVRKSSDTASELYRIDTSSGAVHKILSTSRSFVADREVVRPHVDSVQRVSPEQFVFTDADALGESLWISDGTELGTRRLLSTEFVDANRTFGEKDVISQLQQSNGNTFFATHPAIYNGGNRDHVLWTVSEDQRAKAVFLPDVGRGYLFDILGAVNGRLLFSAQSGDRGEQTVWATTPDGNGIEPLIDAIPMAFGANEFAAAQGDDFIYFYSSDQSLGKQQYRDGTCEYVHNRYQCAPRSHTGPASTFRPDRLWRSDGTAEGTMPVEPTDAAYHLFELYKLDVLPQIEGRFGDTIATRPTSPLPDSNIVLLWTGDERQIVRFENIRDSQLPLVTDTGIYVALDDEDNPGIWRFEPDAGIWEPVDGLGDASFALPLQELSSTEQPGLVQVDLSLLGDRLITDGENVVTLPMDNFQSNAVSVDTGFLLDKLRLSTFDSQFTAETAANVWELSAVERELQLLGDGTETFRVGAPATVVDLSNSAAAIRIDFDALSSSATKRVSLTVAPNSTVELVGDRVDQVRFDEVNGHVLVRVAGFELLVRSDDEIQMVDSLGGAQRFFRSTEFDDRIRLVEEAGRSKIVVESPTASWAVQLRDLGTQAEIGFELGSGSDHVLVHDAFFDSLSYEDLRIEFSEAVNGHDRSAIDLSESFSIAATDGGLEISNADEAVTLRFPNETRRLQNPIDRYDTNLDRRVSAIDALRVINHLAGMTENASDLLDVSGDGRVSPMDALAVINRLGVLNSQPGEAEDVLENGNQPSDTKNEDWFWYEFGNDASLF